MTLLNLMTERVSAVITRRAQYVLTTKLHPLVNNIYMKYNYHIGSQPLVQQIGNYTLAYLTNMYRKYKHNDRSIYCCNFFFFVIPLQA